MRVRAPPVEGRANSVVCMLIARRLGLAEKMVNVTRGGRSRYKLVRIEGLEAAEVRDRLFGGR